MWEHVGVEERAHPGDQLPPRGKKASVRQLAKGVQCQQRIDINNRVLDQPLAESPPDGSFGEFQASFDPAQPDEGTNTIEIHGQSCRGDVDDFEFVNLQVGLSP